MTDDDWIEEPAIIRRPKNKKLADARDAEGWSRGFTAKTGKEGPEHIHIRKMRDDELNREPPVGPDEPTQPPQTWGEWFSDAVAEAVANALNEVIEELKPHAADWWNTTAVPAMKEKVVELRGQLRARKIEKLERKRRPALDVGAPEAAGGGEATPEVAADGDQRIVMTREQYDQLALMATDEFRAWVVDALSKADVAEGAPPVLDQLEEIRELPPPEKKERVQEILATDPAILHGLEQHVFESAHGDLE